MNVLSLYFKRDSVSLEFKVLDQDCNIIKRGCGTVCKENGIRISSVDCPDLYSEDLYLRGEDARRDRVPGYCSFEYDHEVTSYILKVENALRSLASLRGWKFTVSKGDGEVILMLERDAPATVKKMEYVDEGEEV